MLKLSLMQLTLVTLLSTTVTLAHNNADSLTYAGHNPYQHMKILDPDGKFKLEWAVDWDVGRVIFNVSVETVGFVALGFSKDDPATSQGNDLVDYVIGGVDWNGGTYLRDMHATGNEIPVADLVQDWSLISTQGSGTHTHLSFLRLFDTGDPQDFAINGDTLILTWAYGETGNLFESWEYAVRGSVPMYLLDPDLTPLEIQKGSGDGTKLVGGGDLKIWSISANFEIPSRRTTYWCRIYKLDLPSKHHIVGVTFNINNDTKSKVHHMLFLRCTIPNPSSTYEQFVTHPGEECYTQEDQLGEIPFQSCLELKAGYGIGGRPIFYPGTFGLPIGESGLPEYYLLQTHYDNPEGRTRLLSEARVDIYYTDKLRPNDGGILSIGHHVPGSPSILIPPGSSGHRIHGDCSSTCTKRMLGDPIKIIAALLHAHNAGRRVTIQHFRGKEELPNILDDRNWKPDFQTLRLLRNEVTVLPGDQVRVRCQYDTTSWNHSIVGGYGSNQEMCKIFAIYYQNIPQYSICRSELISAEFTANYLAGTRSLTWSQSHLEFVTTDPMRLDGMTLSEISDSSYVNWDKEQRESLQRAHDLLPQLPICPTMEEAQAHAKVGITPHCKALRFGDISDAPWCKRKKGI